MKKDAFMKELEYLLQDIPDEDKNDAIAYYRDYLEEAGPEKEEETLGSFGSPERIAAIIRSDLRGDLEEGGGFTENGYEDERFREPNFQLIRRPEVSTGQDEETGGPAQGADEEGQAPGQDHAGNDSIGDENVRDGDAGNGGTGYGYGMGQSIRNGCAGNDRTGNGRPRWQWWQIVGAIALACIMVPIVLPLIFGIGGGAVGILFGVGGMVTGLLTLFGGILVTMTIALGAVTIALFLAGILLIILGFSHMAVPVQGILYLGTGLGVLGLGFLCLSLCGLYYGRFLPWLGTSVINLVSRILHRKERRREKVY